MNGQSTAGVFKEATGMSIGCSIVMIVLGVMAILMPYSTGIGVSIFVGWIMVFSGFAYLAYAFVAQRAGSFLWRMLVGIVYVGGGGYLAFHPGIALESLTSSGGGDFLHRGRYGDSPIFPISPLVGFRMDSL